MPIHRGKRPLGIAVAAVAVLAILALGASVLVRSNWSASHESLGLAAATGAVAAAAPNSVGRQVCGQPIVKSPYTYHGAAGSYKSGKAGLPTFGKAGTPYWWAKAGVVLPTGNHYYAGWQLRPYTVYYLEPGVHIGAIQADTGDVFIGGRNGSQPSVLSGQYLSNFTWAIDSNTTDGNQSNVTVQYLTIEKYKPNVNSAAINMDTNTGWAIKNNVITLNVPGAGVLLGAGNILRNNCITLNGQYGFQSEATDTWGKDALTGGPHNLAVEDNEISFNDTCDFRGLLNNPSIGWKNFNPVPAQYRNPHCGSVTGDGDQGGFKLWQTDNVLIQGNYIHNNWGPGAWADTNNANTTYTGNTITNNLDEAITEEVSYNFAITNNYIANNNWYGGLSNWAFPSPAIYISESGSDATLGGVPGKYKNQSVISGNTLVNNGGSIFLWQNSNRYCSDGSDGPCTMVAGGAKGPFTVAACHENLLTAAVNTTTFVGEATGSPAKDWWDGCLWRTENVSITKNVIDFNPAAIPHCTKTIWPACGATGVFSEYGSPPNAEPGWVVTTDITFFQHNVWADNAYKGPSIFLAWNQGNGYNPVSWANWTGNVAKGDKCGSTGERRSGFCTGPFGQDAGSTYTSKP